MEDLWKRFRQRIDGFVSFANPGELEDVELAYKRSVLERFCTSLGREKLAAQVTSGAGEETVRQLQKTLKFNIVYHGEWTDLRKTGTAADNVLKAFLDVTSGPYRGSATLEPLFAAYDAAGLRPTWPLISVVLWVLRPDDYFPVKPSYFRRLAQESGYALSESAPTAAAFDAMLRFGWGFRLALAPQQPRDWIDVQSIYVGGVSRHVRR